MEHLLLFADGNLHSPLNYENKEITRNSFPHDDSFIFVSRPLEFDFSVDVH